MAYIEQFTVEGLAGRTEPLTAVLNRDVNVFYGLNGSGKTTLLKILHSALSTETGILENLPFARARVKVYLNRYGKSFTRTFDQPQKPGPGEDTAATAPVSQGRLWQNIFEHRPLPSFGAVDYDLINAISSVRPVWSSDPPEPDSSQLTSYGQNFLPISRLYRNVTTSTGAKRLSDQELDSAFARGLQVQWSQYYAETSKRITQVQERGFANILGFFLAGGKDQGDQSDAPSAAEAYKRITGFLKRQPGLGRAIPGQNEFTVLYGKRPELRNVVKQIEDVERSIDEVTAPRERFRTTLESMYTGSKHLVFTEKEIKVELPKHTQIGLSFLSSGEKQLLYIALHALVSSNQSLIIDEPELSMHVDWQRKLVAILCALNPDMQLIMATHSPEIMADIPDAKIFSL